MFGAKVSGVSFGCLIMSIHRQRNGRTSRKCCRECVCCVKGEREFVAGPLIPPEHEFDMTEMNYDAPPSDGLAHVQAPVDSTVAAATLHLPPHLELESRAMRERDARSMMLR